MISETVPVEQFNRIWRWLSAVETGRAEPNYGLVTTYDDGPGDVRQITYGKFQTTEHGGKLKNLIRAFLRRWNINPKIREQLENFLAAPEFSMARDGSLLATLRDLGDDPIMQATQDDFFQRMYFTAADAWMQENGLTLPLSRLVVYDSWIQSGGILPLLRRRFPAVPPAQGGDEKTWITQYTQARHQWLKYWGDGKSEKSMALRASIYRTTGLLQLIERNQWNLSGRISVNGISIS